MSAHHRLSNHHITEEILTDSSDALRDAAAAAADLRAARVRYVNGVFTNTLRIIFTCQLLYMQRKVRCPHNNWVSFIVNYLLMICNATCLVHFGRYGICLWWFAVPVPCFRFVLYRFASVVLRTWKSHTLCSYRCSHHFKLTCFRNEYVFSTPA